MSVVRLHVDGRPVRVPAGVSLAAVLALVGVPARRSVRGEPRAPLCGMGVCFECRVRVDGQSHVRACITTVRDGMEVEADDPSGR